MALGDHIFVYNWGYSHHGIDCGDGKVIHFDFDPRRKLLSTILNRDLSQIRETTLEEFSRGRTVHVRQYDQCDDPQTVVARARSRVGESGYHLFGNNCEHFSVWCKSCIHESTQVEAAKSAATPLRYGSIVLMMLRSASFLSPQVKMAVCTATVGTSVGTAVVKYVRQRARDTSERRS